MAPEIPNRSPGERLMAQTRAAALKWCKLGRKLSSQWTRSWLLVIRDGFNFEINLSCLGLQLFQPQQPHVRAWRLKPGGLMASNYSTTSLSAGLNTFLHLENANGDTRPAACEPSIDTLSTYCTAATLALFQGTQMRPCSRGRRCT